MRRKQPRHHCSAMNGKCLRKPFLDLIVSDQAMRFCKAHLYLVVLFLTDIERHIGDPAWKKAQPF